MAKERPDYHSYLLRLWREGGGHEGSWRASLEHPRTRERRGFACLDELFCFLERQMGARPVSQSPLARTYQEEAKE